MINILKALNAGLSFFLEMALIGAIVFYGFHSYKTAFLKISVGVVVPALLIGFWGMWMAPNSAARFGDTLRTIVASLLFMTAAFLLYKAGKPTLGLSVAIATVVNTVLVVIFKQ